MIYMILGSLVNHNPLKKIHALCRSNVLVQGAKEIAELLRRNSSLRVIELNNNMIDYSVSSF